MNAVKIKTFVATKNLGKLQEMRAIFLQSELDLEVYPQYAQPIEGAVDYAENAGIKARTLRDQLREAGVSGAVLADDSGIEVYALGGRPGVLSARYGGVDLTWPERRAKLLGEMAEVPQEERGAKFCCAMALLLEDGTTYFGYGEVEGSITRGESGGRGFGYDPIFWYEPAGKTFAQMSEVEKNGISHRRLAADALLAVLRSGA